METPDDVNSALRLPQCARLPGAAVGLTGLEACLYHTVLRGERAESMFLHLCLVATALCSGAHPGQEGGALEKVARLAIGRVLSYVLETDVSVGGIRLDTKAETLELSDLRIANPKGFEADQAFSLGKVLVDADPKSLFSDAPTIRRIEVSGAKANVEVNLKGVNLKKLADSASRFKPPGAQGPKKHGQTDDPNAKKWRIAKALMENCSVDIITALPFKQTTRRSIDKIDLDLSGPDGTGLPANEAMAQVLNAIMDKLGLLKGVENLGSLALPSIR